MVDAVMYAFDERPHEWQGDVPMSRFDWGVPTEAENLRPSL
jgi:hypothetical protein